MYDLKERAVQTKEGWSIHVYNSNRHLLCAIGPSHGWAFGLGTLVGGLVLIIFSNLPWSNSTGMPATVTPTGQTLPSPKSPDSTSPQPSIFWFE